jgi:hypothetical protein
MKTYWEEQYQETLRHELRRESCTRRSPMIVGGLIIVGFMLLVMYLTAGGGSAPTYTTDPDGQTVAR